MAAPIEARANMAERLQPRQAIVVGKVNILAPVTA
jgi:hypothetical protein